MTSDVTSTPDAAGFRRVRVLCQDEAGRVLVLRWRDPFDGREFYEPPGGGIEPGETPAEAARRELLEETGLSGELSERFVAVERRHTWNGEHRHELEPFFLATFDYPVVAPAALTESELATLVGWTWAGTAEELDAALEPPDTFEVLAELRVLASRLEGER